MSARLGNRPRVAIIGGGIAGIMSAWRLQHSHEVTIFEAGASLGGHAHAIEAAPGVWLDTGFIIFNTGTYPLFLDFLTQLGIRDRAREMRMSFCFSDADRKLHYAVHHDLYALFHGGRNLLRADYWRIVKDLLRFRSDALKLLAEGVPPQPLGDFLSAYSAPFAENFLRPMAMAIWTLPDTELERFPVGTLLEFMNNHSLLRGPGAENDAWLSFSESSRIYVEAFRQQFKGQVRTQSPIASVARIPDGIEVRTLAGEQLHFDQAIMATHADTSLKLLAEPTPLEQKLLGAWRYQPNRITIHSDPGPLPADRRLWSSWNICRRDGDYRVSYYLNRVHNLNLDSDYFLTLGEGPIDEKSVHARFEYAHPIFDAAAVATRPRLPELNLDPRLAFCGSYFGYGFHEDAIRAAIAAAEALQQHSRVLSP